MNIPRKERIWRLEKKLLETCPTHATRKDYPNDGEQATRPLEMSAKSICKACGKIKVAEVREYVDEKEKAAFIESVTLQSKRS